MCALGPEQEARGTAGRSSKVFAGQAEPGAGAGRLHFLHVASFCICSDIRRLIFACVHAAGEAVGGMASP